MTLYNQFINNVNSKPEDYCHLVKESVNRHLSDLEEAKKKSYKYYFNEEENLIEQQRFIQFLHKSKTLKSSSAILLCCNVTLSFNRIACFFFASSISFV